MKSVFKMAVSALLVGAMTSTAFAVGSTGQFVYLQNKIQATSIESLAANALKVTYNQCAISTNDCSDKKTLQLKPNGGFVKVAVKPGYVLNVLSASFHGKVSNFQFVKGRAACSAKWNESLLAFSKGVGSSYVACWHATQSFFKK